MRSHALFIPITPVRLKSKTQEDLLSLKVKKTKKVVRQRALDVVLIKQSADCYLKSDICIC